MLDEPEAATPETPQRLHRCCSWRSEQHKTVCQPVWSSNISLQKSATVQWATWSIMFCRYFELYRLTQIYIYLLRRQLQVLAEKENDCFSAIMTLEFHMIGNIANERTTFNAFDPVWMLHRLCPIEEADSAVEELAGSEPLTEWDHQPAGDAVIFPFLHSSVVGRHAMCDVFPVDLPGHAHMVRVESSSHTHQGLLFSSSFLAVLTRYLWRFKHLHCWRADSITIWICQGKGKNH